MQLKQWWTVSVQNATSFQGELKTKAQQRYSLRFASLPLFGEVFYFSKVRSILSKNFGLCVLHKPFLYNVHKHLYTSAVLDISRYL